MGDVDGNDAGVHSEHDAINKLKPLYRKRHLESVNILVVRLSKSNNLLNSKPCANCIQTMLTLPQKKGYCIKYVYYSNDNGSIVKTSLKKLSNQDLHYSSFNKKYTRKPVDCSKM